MFILPTKIAGLLFFSFFFVLETEEKKLEKKYGQCHFFDTFCGSVPVNLFLFNIALQWGKFNIDSTKSGKQISAVLASSNYTKIIKYYLPYRNPNFCPHPQYKPRPLCGENPSTPGENHLDTGQQNGNTIDSTIPKSKSNPRFSELKKTYELRASKTRLKPQK